MVPPAVSSPEKNAIPESGSGLLKLIQTRTLAPREHLYPPPQVVLLELPATGHFEMITPTEPAPTRWAMQR